MVKSQKQRRMTLKQALADAAEMRAAELAQYMEQAEALSAEGAPDEYAPDCAEAVQVLFVTSDKGDGDDGDDGDEGSDDERSMIFSHFCRKDGNSTHYSRSFASVRDFCEQPFANKANEELWKREEFIDGHFREWGKGFMLRSTHDEGDISTEERTRRKNISWFGAEHADEAAARAFHGWPEGADKIRSMMSDVDAPPPVSLRRKVQRADQGDELDVHSVYRGDLDHAWTRRRRQRSRGRMSVRIVALLGGSNMMEGEEMFWRGAAVAKLAEVLDESGYRTEIIGVNQNNIDGHEVSTHSNFIVKDAAAPLDLEQVAGVVANPGFFRTWGFRDAYAMCEHKLQDTVRVPETKWVRILGKDKRVETGKVKVQTLMARSYVRSDDPVKEGALDADGTKTFSVPVSIFSAERAAEWVNKCVAELDAEVQS